MDEEFVKGLKKGVNNALVDLVERVYKYSSSKSKTTVDRLRLKFVTNFTDYLLQTAIRCSKVKTLISRTDPVNIEDFYVPVRLKMKGTSLSEHDIIEYLYKGEQFIISGIAGSGKSMTMRYLYLSLCKRDEVVIPVFVELRHISFKTNQDVIGYVISKTRCNKD